MFFSGVLTLSLADGFGRADYGRASCYSGNDAEDHCEISHQDNLGDNIGALVVEMGMKL